MENNLSSTDELKTIRKIMEESSRFLSLSGLSGVFAGLFAMAGALVAWFFILDRGAVQYDDILRQVVEKRSYLPGWYLIVDALVILVLSLCFSLYFSVRKAHKAGRNLWTPVTKQLLVNFFIPLMTGGLFAVILLMEKHPELIVPALLIFYGLALMNAGKFTYGEIFYLGLFEIVIGLIAAVLFRFGILFWAIGFGLLHIVYGLIMYRKYES